MQNLRSVSIIDMANFMLDKFGCQSVLELGCGDGCMIAALNVGARVGIDAWDAQIAKCNRAHPEVSTICAKLDKLPTIVHPKSFDAVVGFDILEHLPDPVYDDVLDYAAKIATKLVFWFGPLGFSENVHDTTGSNYMKHVHEVKVEDFTQRGYDIGLFPHFWDKLPNIPAYIAWRKQ